jgi:hypothetical protein
MKLAYCDKIADVIRKSLLKYDTDDILNGPVGRIEMDLHPEGGYLVSTKKAIKVWDSNGKAYVVTVEEAPMLDIEFEDIDKKVVDNELN